MIWYAINQQLTPVQEQPSATEPALVILTSKELAHQPSLSGLEKVLVHAPVASESKVCKAELHSGYISGTLVSPRIKKGGERLAYGFLITDQRLVWVDDTGVLLSYCKHLIKTKTPVEQSVGRLFFTIMELIISKDLHHLEEIEDHADQLEDQVLSGNLDNFSSLMTPLRKESTAWFRYYSQLAEVADELQRSENTLFGENIKNLFHLYEKRVVRLREEARLLRESCTQIQTMFQAEIDIRQNHIMKILTLVTTIFLPLSLLVGWYGMNFINMPELTWAYGYPAVIALSLLIVAVSLWICKRKKFW